MRRRFPWDALALVVVGFIQSCDEGPTYSCTASVEPGVIVHVTVASTGEPAAHGVVATVRDGSYVDTLEAASWVPPGVSPESLGSLRGADERAGVYDLEILKPGFEDWFVHDVVVTAGVCHVRTVVLDARLQQAP